MSPLRQRQPRVRNGAFKAYVSRSPCIACMVEGRGVNTEVHVAHLRAGSLEYGKRPTGAGEKPSDQWCLGLCPADHLYSKTAQHVVGEAAFYERLGVDPFLLCLDLNAAFEAGAPPFGIIARHAGLAQRRRREASND